ncbi:MAG: tetratricopeptide repeat protein [Candidatus Bipolaricaulia bacterium]
MKRKSLVLILGVAFALVAIGVAFIVPRLGQAPQQSPVAQDKALTEQIKLYESKVGEEPENADYRAKLGELYFQGGDWDKALGNFTKAVELDPQNVDLQIKLAIIYWHSGDIEAGIRQLDEALQLDPSRVTTRFYRGILLSTVKGREAEAIAELEEVIKLDPNSELAGRARTRLAELGADVSVAPSPLPQSLGGLPLQSYSEGKEALAEINKLHNSELPITAGYVGSYSDGTRSVKLWIAESDDPGGLLQQMLESIREGKTPFSAPEEVAGLETQVYSAEGMSQTHYIWVEGNLLIWMALEGFTADEEMKVLKEALKITG